ncbi:hypothetical protein [Butyrivibrio sp. AC2005]|uniref:hypothetical protein n=1 Tax=Butyrivibrio sp. AC2005 TaxID=1280672 RepID=UPI000420B1BE|nr:hypothetical protein [Butyrivibrio sp. AC2005]
MAESKEYIDVYKKAEEYLLTITPAGVDLEKYYIGDNKDYKTLDDIFVRFIHSAQNYQSMPNVIAFKKRKEEVGKILHGFDHVRVSAMNPKELCQTFRDAFGVKSADNKNNSWSKWSHAIVDSAKFLMEFKNPDDFEKFVNLFGYNVHTSMALPLLISHKINGIGFALACDLLKELGFTRYPKPDVHLMDVFSSFGLSEHEQISTFEAIVRMANYVYEDGDKTVTPYKVDKIFWLICSGKFYMEDPVPPIISHKKEFIDMMLNR